MKKSIMKLCVFITIILTICSCGTNEDKDTEVGERVIEDINGDMVTIPTEINRIICRSGNGTSFLVAMGYGDKLVGTADYVVTNPWVDRFYSGTSKLPTFGWEPSSEEIYRVGADLVMIADPNVASNLRKDGITAICYKQYNGEEIIKSAELLGELLGEDAKKYTDKWINYYNEIDDYIKEKLADVKEEDKPVVYYIYGQANKGLGRTAGGDSIIEFLIEEAGGIFATSDLPNDGPKITEEEAIKRNPDVILVSGVYGVDHIKALETEPAWQGVAAVANNQIYQIPIDFISWDFYGVEVPLFKLWISEQLYPDLIDRDIFEEAKQFYKEFYNMELKDEEIKYILNGLDPEGNTYVNE